MLFFFSLVTPPAQRVQFILGEDHDGDSGHEPHPLFSEMEELFLDEDGEMEWKETARYVCVCVEIPNEPFKILLYGAGLSKPCLDNWQNVRSEHGI